MTAARRPSDLALGIYGAAFLLVVGAAATIAAASIGSLRRTGLLWASVALSGVAIALAVVALLVPQREV